MFRLDEMTTNEFKQYLSYAVKNYADEHVRAGRWNENESINEATKEFEKLLPEGEKTANNYLFVIRVKGEEVGMIWLAQRSKEKGYIYDINILDNYQGHGYGKQAMTEIELIAKKLDMKSISLHVFGHNQVARQLYEKLGYIETNIIMEKNI